MKISDIVKSIWAKVQTGDLSQLPALFDDLKQLSEQAINLFDTLFGQTKFGASPTPRVLTVASMSDHELLEAIEDHEQLIDGAEIAQPVTFAAGAPEENTGGFAQALLLELLARVFKKFFPLPF